MSDRWRTRCGLALAASWFSILTVQSECDNVDFETLVKNKLLNPEEEQTGWDRLAAMYTLDEMGGLTPELELVASIGTTGLLAGGAMGAVLNGRLAVAKFIDRNQATAFETQLSAKRALQDRIMIAMSRGFFMFGWRTALFTSSFGLVSTSLMVYTNEISALHYVAAGFTSGALYKVTMGLRGMAAGAVAGSLLGLLGGGVISLLCYVTDTTLPKLRYQQYVWKHQQDLRMQARAERKREKRRLAAEKKAEHAKEDIVNTQLDGAGALRGSVQAADAVAAEGPAAVTAGASRTEAPAGQERCSGALDGPSSASSASSAGVGEAPAPAASPT
ncbi:RPII140-upstream gene protein-like [Pollicipes pollicipes]|uniref:RPII140-upstream gene protein-like n=1 Tax=Pollicipes pollicipes TaxID=41117 RepID=UPI0018851156|nr:RPII140-upstream gene protein-like [Pollicipes pollicipes]